MAVVGFTVLAALVALLRCKDPGRGRLYLVVRSIVNEMAGDRDCHQQLSDRPNSFSGIGGAFLRPDTGKQSTLQQGSAQETLCKSTFRGLSPFGIVRIDLLNL